jgi:hypothetical protein
MIWVESALNHTALFGMLVSSVGRSVTGGGVDVQATQFFTALPAPTATAAGANHESAAPRL